MCKPSPNHLQSNQVQRPWKKAISSCSNPSQENPTKWQTPHFLQNPVRCCNPNSSKLNWWTRLRGALILPQGIQPLIVTDQPEPPHTTTSLPYWLTYLDHLRCMTPPSPQKSSMWWENQQGSALFSITIKKWKGVITMHNSQENPFHPFIPHKPRLPL